MDKIVFINTPNMEYLKKTPDNYFDLIITSPPYNLKNRGGAIKIDTYKDNLPNNEYERQQIEFLNECYRVLKPLGAMFYNHKNRYEKNEIINPYIFCFKSKMKINQEIIWNRKTTVDYNRTRFAPLDEKIFWLYKEKTFKLKTGASLFTNIWEINRPTRIENMGHKATFPSKLIFRIINSLDMNYKTSNIIDPYMGTGTTLQVGKHFNFKEIVGCEVDTHWIEQAKIKVEQPLQILEQIPKVKNSYKQKA